MQRTRWMFLGLALFVGAAAVPVARTTAFAEDAPELPAYFTGTSADPAKLSQVSSTAIKARMNGSRLRGELKRSARPRHHRIDALVAGGHVFVASHEV